MRRWAAMLALVLLGAAPCLAWGQQTDGPARQRPDTLPPGRRAAPGDSVPAGDSAGRDTTRAELVRWAEEDSVMRALLEREGYSVTRYQGSRVTFDATGRTIALSGTPAARAAVGREQTVLVGDTVFYNDSTQRVRAFGDTVILRDPSRGSDDLVSYGDLAYDIGERRGVVSDVRTSVESGAKWFVGARRGAITGDTTGRGNAGFYGVGGAVTSCNLTVPHYHFKSGELKVIRNRVLVARPAVLYIYDVPVLWLPFVFQDLREGRRSGLLPPRFGFSELVRSSPSYRRHFENLGYYFALNDYMDAEVALDWRSGARATEADPGWLRYNAEWRYKWLDRFLNGRIAANYQTLSDQSKNYNVSWQHSQDFSQTTHLTSDINYTSSTRILRQTSINPYQALATIQSRVNYQQQLGPASVSLGGSMKQYPGRGQRDLELPTLNVSTKPITVGDWFNWTPTLALSNNQSDNVDSPGELSFRFRPGASGLAEDSTAITRDTRNSTLNLNTPIKIFGFTWRNTFNVTDRENDFPEALAIENVVPRADGGADTVRSTRVYARTYQTAIDWQTGIDLPTLSQGKWNITPNVQIVNVDPSAFWIRSNFTGDAFVRQSKRLQYGISTSPTFFGLFPGFGPVSRFRHSITPTISYSFAPEGQVSDAFLQALGRSRADNLASIRQNAVSLNLTQNIEAKLVSRTDTAPDAGRKVKVLSLDVTPLTYNFERLAEIRRRSANPSRVSAWQGLTTNNFDYTVTSELLPGFSFRSGYSLFQGSTESDTAVFKPFRESISLSFSVNRNSGIFAAFTRIFGRSIPLRDSARVDGDTTQDTTTVDDEGDLPVAGSDMRDGQYRVPSGRGFQSSISYSSTRQRPPVGGNVIFVDPQQACAFLRDVNPFAFDQCIASNGELAGVDNNFDRFLPNQPIRVNPPLEMLNAQTSFNITPKWAAQWSTSYNIREKEFGSQIVTLQREMHDWRAIFSFTQSPNGAFAFTFFIALNAQPDLKFNYDQQSFRRGASQ